MSEVKMLCHLSLQMMISWIDFLASLGGVYESSLATC